MRRAAKILVEGSDKIMNVPAVMLSYNASGAVECARLGYVVVIVDIIDMSTTAEALLDAGALEVYGASPDTARPPVAINPEKVGKLAGRRAVQAGTSVVVVAEPRTGSSEERKRNITAVIKGIESTEAKILAILPNMGAETPRLFDVSGKVIVAATGTGGVAFDAALNAGAPAVITGTVARTLRKKGTRPAAEAARRAIERARKLDTGVGVVAASANSLEDILAAEYLTRLIVQHW